MTPHGHRTIRYSDLPNSPCGVITPEKIEMVFRDYGGSQASYHTTNKIMETQTTRKIIKRPAMKIKVATEDEEERVIPRPASPAPAPESSEPESSDDETESVASEPESSESENEDAECQTEFGSESSITEREVRQICENTEYKLKEEVACELQKLDEQIAENMESERRQMEETFEERLAEMRRQMMEDTEQMLAQKLATLAGGHATIQKQSKKAEKEKKKEEEVKGYYAVPAGVDEIARLRQSNKQLRKESEGKTNTNRKLQEQIANLESEDPVARYVAELKKVREANQVLRKRCEAKDRTYQKMKAMIEALGGKAPEPVRDEDEE